VQARSVAAIRDAVGPDAVQIARVVPELRDAGTESEAPGADESSRFALFDAISRLLAHAAGDQPLVVVLDDLHDADAPSVALLQFAARTLAGEPVLLLAAAREHEAALRDDLAMPLTRIGPNARELALRGLDRDDVAAIVRHHGPGGDPTRLAATLHERTNGNPFFTTACWRWSTPTTRSPRSGCRPACAMPSADASSRSATAAPQPAARATARPSSTSARRPTTTSAPRSTPRPRPPTARAFSELREEIEEAESFNDPERRARGRAELDFIAAELGRAVGLRGRDRPQGSDAERARVNVTR